MAAIFDSKSTSALSEPFVVGLGEVLILSAFGFAASQRAVVEKVRWQAGTMPQGGACFGLNSCKDAKIIGSEDVTQCGQWVMNACQNLVVLSVPGSYRLRLDDGVASGPSDPGDPIPVEPSTGVGIIHIDATPMDRSLAGSSIPDHLFFGFISPNSGCN